MDRLLNATADIYRRSPGTDRYGNAAGTWTMIKRIRVRIEEEPGEEETDDSEATRERARMWTRSEDLQHEDRVVLDGVTWELDGAPVPRQRVSIATHHHEARLKKASL